MHICAVNPVQISPFPLLSTHPPPNPNPGSRLVILLAVENPKNSQEQVDNIQVQRNRRSNLLLNMVMPHDQLSINQNITREDQRRNSAIDQIHRLSTWEESSHESEEDQAPQRPEKVWHPGCKVVFGLAGEERESDEDSGCEDHGLKDDTGVEEGGYDGDGVGFEAGEAGEEDEVHGVGFALPVG